MLPDILELVKSSPCLRGMFVCLDVLDEFPAKHRLELWEYLQQIVREYPNTRLFTERLRMGNEVQKHVSGIAEILPIGLDLWLRVEQGLGARCNGRGIGSRYSKNYSRGGLGDVCALSMC